MVVVVIHPHLHRLPAGLLRVIVPPPPRVTGLIDHQPDVALDLAVMPRRVRADPLMPARQGLDRAGEVGRTVVVAVVRDHPLQVGDAVGGEEEACPREEPDCGRSALITECFGVSQARVPIDR